MADIVGRIIKPTAQFIEDLARKLPEAFGKGHHRIGQSIHKAADEFDKAEDDLTAKAGHRPHDFGEGHHDPEDVGAVGATAAAGAKGGEKAAGDAARDAGEGSHADGDGADDLRGDDLDKAAIPGGERHCATDPVDVATGDMVMAATDVRLPGALPFSLERTHISSYRNGKWFGSSWASTLDQRLQLDAEGVVFATADGMRLQYPPPRGGEVIMPFKGPRLELSWSGVPGDPMRVGDPRSGETLVFDHPRPAPGVPGAIVLRLSAIEDRDRRRVEITWADDDTPALIAHHGGYRVAVDVHPDLPRITALRLLDADGPDGPGTETTLLHYGYDDVGDLVEITDSSGRPLRLTYDDHHRVTRWTDRLGTSYDYTYDEAGRVTATHGTDDFMSSTFSYDEATRTTAFTDSLGHTTTYLRNAAYRLIRTVDPLGNAMLQEWDADNRLMTSVTDSSGQVFRYTYDDADNIVTVARPDGTAANIAYNELCQPVEVNEPDGLTWRHTYDVLGHRLKTNDGAGAETSYTYDAAGNPVTVTDALGHTVHLSHNAAGLVTGWTDQMGRDTRLSYDALGRPVRLTDPLGGITRYTWTVEGLPRRIEYPDGSHESWERDAEGNVTAHTDRAGHMRRIVYTTFDLLATRTMPDGSEYRFSYDTELRLVEVTNPAGLIWEYRYDPAGRLVGETDFNGCSLTYAYDVSGRLASRTSPSGESTRFVRDRLGRVIEEHRGEDVTRFERDPVGRLLRATNASSELVRRFDAARRMVAETVDGLTTTFDYDALSRPTRRATPAGAVSEWTYEADGTPRTMTAAGRTMRFEFDANGRETTRAFDGGAVLRQGWDQCDRLVSQIAGASDGTAVTVDRAYTYGPEGFLIGMRERGRGDLTFGLDTTGRINRVEAAEWSEAYAYDPSGNITRAATPLTDTPDQERLYTGTLIRRAGRTLYEQDDRGRVVRTVKKLLNGQSRVQTFTWDVDDRLVETVTPEGVRWRYLYDPLGRRTAKQRLSMDDQIVSETRFTWDGSQLAEARTSEGRSTTWDYLPGTHQPFAQVDLNDREDIDARFHAIVTDLTGAPRELLTPDGGLAWRRTQTVWGLSRDTDGHAPVTCPLRFPGQYEDPETGWNHNFARHYEPETGRYTSPDPLGLDPAPNHFAYVGNPYSASDPLGLVPNCQDMYDWEGSVRYGRLDHLGRPTGISASVRPEMLDEGSKAGRVTPPGWRGNGDAFNEARGHLLARMLGGVGKGRGALTQMARRNLVTLTDLPTNSPEMRDNFEQKIYDAVDKGETIQYNVKPIYEGTNPIPVRLEISAFDNRGFHLGGRVENPASGVRTGVQ